MTKKDFAEYKRRYHAFRHHAWAGLGFLSVFLAVRIILGENSPAIMDYIIFLLLLYIVIALLFTYRYRSGLSVKDEIVQVQTSVEVEKERINAGVKKEPLKLEKKKVKAEAKKVKKSNK